MPSPAVVPAIALLAGAAIGSHVDLPAWLLAWVLAVCAVLAIAGSLRDPAYEDGGPWSLRDPAYVRRAGLFFRPAFVVIAAAVGSLCAGAALADRARERALDPSLRHLLEAEVGGFAIDSLGPAGDHDPILMRGTLLEDAAAGDGFIALRVRVEAIQREGAWHPASGDVALSVSGANSPRVPLWVAGRHIEAPVTFRRPTRYLNDGVRDQERDLALDGTSLFGSIKSPLLVEVVGAGSWVAERAALIRRAVRAAVDRHVGRHSPLSGAIVSAVLIGDRTGLPDAVRIRLQEAGTYHVIAISGGNIAIFAALALGLSMACGLSGRVAALVACIVLIGYAQVVNAGPSVWRATTMAVIYLCARAVNHRTPPAQAVAVAAVLLVAARPLDVRDAGFLLTFGATITLLDVTRRLLLSRHRSLLRRWLVGSVVASVATEVALLPIGALIFSRITVAGVLLNLVAIPMMALAQVAGLIAVVTNRITPVNDASGWLAHAGATGLVVSANLLDVAPWLSWRVPAPSPVVVCVYYMALGGTLLIRRPRWAIVTAMTIWAVSALVILSGRDPIGPVDTAPTLALRLTMMDVGQGESLLLELPGRSRMLVDAGGAPFGSGGFDIGGRVLAPALWARGVRSLDALLVTHGDPDHLGGAVAVLGDFRPRVVLEGIDVPQHQGLTELRGSADRIGATVRRLRDGMAWSAGRAHVRVLHPPEPDWERPRVRNDDSVVLEVTIGDVALVLTGDISADIERAIAPRLTPATVRILKVAHHGSRTSTSRELLDRWRPQIALVSAGRGNRFGHPAREVIQRLEATGAQIYRTDRDGQITLTTDGSTVQVTTFTGGRRR